jgi:hypothetical protein
VKLQLAELWCWRCVIASFMAATIAKRVARHLQRAGFVVVKRPATGGHSSLGRVLELSDHCAAHGKVRLSVAVIATPYGSWLIVGCSSRKSEKASMISCPLTPGYGQ